MPIVFRSISHGLISPSHATGVYFSSTANGFEGSSTTQGRLHVSLCRQQGRLRGRTILWTGSNIIDQFTGPQYPQSCPSVRWQKDYLEDSTWFHSSMSHPAAAFVWPKLSLTKASAVQVSVITRKEGAAVVTRSRDEDATPESDPALPLDARSTGPRLAFALRGQSRADVGRGQKQRQGSATPSATPIPQDKNWLGSTARSGGCLSCLFSRACGRRAAPASRV